jgi:hypothetical protein
MSTQQDVTRVKEEHKETLLAMPNVVGVGVGFKVEGRTKTSELSVSPWSARSPGRAETGSVPRQVTGWHRRHGSAICGPQAPPNAGGRRPAVSIGRVR